MAGGTEAKEIVETVSKMEDGPGAELDALIKSSTSLSVVPQVDLKLFIERLNSKTAAAVAPRLELIRAGEKTDAGDYPGTSGPAGAAEPKRQRLKLSGTAVFKGDRLVGWLNKAESRGLLWALGKAQSSIVVVKCPGDESSLASLELLELISKIKPEKRGNRIVITVEVQTESNLVEQQGAAGLAPPGPPPPRGPPPPPGEKSPPPPPPGPPRDLFFFFFWGGEGEGFPKKGERGGGRGGEFFQGWGSG